MQPQNKHIDSGLQYLRTTRLIKADDSGALPTDIEVLRTGMWETPWHGNFMVTPNDLNEYVQNFNADIRPSSSSSGLPIDIDHDAGAAAGWMKKLFVQPNNDGGMSLWASVEWTPLGAQKLTDREYTMFSPEFCPEGYYDPEGEAEPCDNVLIGGGLTNRPLFKDLQPIVASEKSGKPADKGEFKKIYVSAKENTVPTLEETRTKDVASLSDEEKRLLADNKADLSAEEQAKFGLADAPVNNEAPVADPPADPAIEQPVVEASDKVVTISAGEKKKLEDMAALGVAAHQKLVQADAEKHVDELVYSQSKGFKFASDMRGDIVKLYTSANDEQKTTLDKLFENAKPIKASSEMGAKGSSSDLTNGASADNLKAAADELVKESNGKLNFSEALIKASEANPELSKNYKAELESQPAQN